MIHFRSLCAGLALTLAAACAASGAVAAPRKIDESGARVMSISTKGGNAHQRITLPLDKAAVVQLDTDARDVLVSNPDLVDAVVRTPRRIFLLATKVGQTNAFFFDAEGKQILTIDIRVEKDVVDLGSLMKAAMPNSSIQVQALNDSVVLTGQVPSALEATRAADLAAKFTGDPKKVVNMIGIAAGQQVMLKVRIAEMNRNIAKQFNVNISAAAKLGGVPMVASTANPFGLMGRALSDMSGGQIGQACSSQFFPTVSQSVSSALQSGSSVVSSVVNGATGSSTTGFVTVPITNAAGQVTGYTQAPIDSMANTVNSATTTTQNIASGTPMINRNVSSTSSLCPNNGQGILQALEQVGLVHMLAEPNLTAVSGETARFLAGGEFPVPVSRDRDGNITVSFKQFGVGLSFTPVVIAPGRISLQLSSEVSELSNTGSFNLGGVSSLNIPALSVRRTQTTVELPSGGSFAVAGLLQHNTKQVIDGFPGVKDLPVLGALFRSRDFADDQTELVVLVSAYLVEPNSESAFSSPTDGFVAPSDPQTLLMGRLNATYKKDDKPASGQAAAPVGFIVR